MNDFPELQSTAGEVAGDIYEAIPRRLQMKVVATKMGSMSSYIGACRSLAIILLWVVSLSLMHQADS